jgi:23S rRNA (cytosine1962-C5)-methyltransferase
VDYNGSFVGRGFYNQNSDIAVRLLTLNPNEAIDLEFFRKRIRRALCSRELRIDKKQTDVFRLINAEGDLLPGFIVDYFAGCLSIQSHTAGSDALTDVFISALQEEVSPTAIILRNEAGVRKREGLTIETPRIIQGTIDGEILVKENNITFSVDVLKGQKTGFFTDQRDKRLSVQEYCRRLPSNAVLLNCFCYSASFSIYALLGNRSLRTVNIDQSERALSEAVRSFQLNNISELDHTFECSDVSQFLDSAKNKRYEVVIVDPPAFAKSAKDKQRAWKAYIRLFKQALNVCADGALIVLCSCSGVISISDFEQIVRDSAAESGKILQIVETFQHGIDHPVLASAPETSYLKVFFCRVVSP